MWQRLFVAIVVAVLSPTTGHAVTVPVTVDQFEMATPWRHPGTNPCRNSADCTPAWAAEAMFQAGAIPAAVRDEFLAREASGDPRARYWVEPGADIRVNTYAKNGVPYIQQYMRADFADGESRLAHGHQIYHDDVRYDLVLVAECGNWVLLTHTPRTYAYLPSAAAPTYPVGYTPPGTDWYGGSPRTPLPPVSVPPGIPDIPDGHTDCTVCVPWTPEEPPVVPPEEPPVVPLPPSLILIISALLLLSSLSFGRRYQPV